MDNKLRLNQTRCTQPARYQERDPAVMNIGFEGEKREAKHGVLRNKGSEIRITLARK
jgi:hypothetical protein